MNPIEAPGPSPGFDDEWPKAKPPKEFTGIGFEVIGDSSEELRHFSLWFQDSDFAGLQYPSRETQPEWTPETTQEWHKKRRKSRAENLAHQLSKNPDDSNLEMELAGILKQCQSAAVREQQTERAVLSIKRGGIPSNWPARLKLQRAACIAVMETSKELRRPPTEYQVIGRMRVLEEQDNSGQDHKMTSDMCGDGSLKNIQKFLRKYGFGWLERLKRGEHGR